MNGVLIGCLYLPNGNPDRHRRNSTTSSAGWSGSWPARPKMLAKLDCPVVLAGDYNIIPTDARRLQARALADDALFQPEPRAQYAKLLKQGWTDALRQLHPRRDRSSPSGIIGGNSFARNAGIRIDHLLLNKVAAKRLKAAGVDRDVRAREKASDHAPTWVELSDGD